MLSIIAPLALLATTAVASSVGSAVVVNACDYDVYLFAVPGDDDVSSIDKTLSYNETWEQEWTELANESGWSIKLSQDSTLDGSNLMQYEYTWLDDGTIWYDLSEVNGNPWDGNWEITTDSSDCSPRQAAYRYATDDAYGMQSCPGSATITVTLCSGGDSSDDSSSSSSSVVVESSTFSSQVESSTVAAASTTTHSAKASTTAAASSSAKNSVGDNRVAAASTTVVSSSVTPTTFATAIVTTAPNNDVVTVVETQVVTEVAYTTYYNRGNHFGRRQHADAHKRHNEHIAA